MCWITSQHNNEHTRKTHEQGTVVAIELSDCFLQFLPNNK